MTAPAEPTPGVVQVMTVSEMTLMAPTEAPPMVTEVAPVKFSPTIVTAVPPGCAPDAGEMLSTRGGGA